MEHSDGKTDCALDMDIALSHVDGDRKFLAELAEMFVQDYPHLIHEARSSILQDDPVGLERAAHTLQGRLAFFGIYETRGKALKLEKLARSKNLAKAHEALAVVEADMERILPEVESLYREQKP